MAEEILKRTPLYETHLRLGGKMVPFGGWDMPVQYPAGVIAEHMAVRLACGLFDVSHMGEILCTGPDAVKNLNHLLTNDFTDLEDNAARYSPMCNEHGGVVDDLIVYRRSAEEFLLVVNASNKDKDFAWICEHTLGEVQFTDISDQVAQVAVQGPAARRILAKVMDLGDIPQKYYTCLWDRKVGEIPCRMIATTGYTGEDGVEICVAPEHAEVLWQLLMEAGKEDGILPCGLGARDTLRLEAGMPLYGHEMDDETTPLEAGLGMFVKPEKEEFVGREALLAANPPARKKIGLEAVDRGILREHMDVYRNGEWIGRTTSGTKCPAINKAVACALVKTKARELGAEVEVDVRGRRVRARMVSPLFYKRENR